MIFQFIQSHHTTHRLVLRRRIGNPLRFELKISKNRVETRQLCCALNGKCLPEFMLNGIAIEYIASKMPSTERQIIEQTKPNTIVVCVCVWLDSFWQPLQNPRGNCNWKCCFGSQKVMFQSKKKMWQKRNDVWKMHRKRNLLCEKIPIKNYVFNFEP